jgi:uncharacterized membrane protein YqhA
MEGTIPIDAVMLVVELLVLILIAYEVIVGQLRHREEEQRRLFLGEKVSDLSN